MISPITAEHPRTGHLRMVAAVNNVGMCANLLKQINDVMDRNLRVLKEHRDAFADATPEGIAIAEFADQSLKLAASLSVSELYTPDCGAALAALTAKLPQVDSASGAAHE